MCAMIHRRPRRDRELEKMRTPASSRELELTRLLLSLFEVGELWTLLGITPDHGLVLPEDVFVARLGLLARKEGLPADFFDRVRAFRPTRRPEIDQMEARWKAGHETPVPQMNTEQKESVARIMAKFYTLPEQVHKTLLTAGLPPVVRAFNGDMVLYWEHILEDAWRRKDLVPLMQLASKEYPEVPHFKAWAQSFAA